MSLSFREHRFEEPKYSPEECKEKDLTYSAPLFVTAEFVNFTTGEIKSQTVFMGDFPLMTPRGTFIVNGTERVVVSQLVRSPGVYFERTPDKTSDKDVFTAKIIPSRGAWLEFEIDKRDFVGVRVDRKRKQSMTVLLKALGMTEGEIRGEFADFPAVIDTLEKDSVQTQDEALLDLYRRSVRANRPPSTRAARCSRTSTSTPSATTSRRSVATSSTRSSARTPSCRPRSCAPRTSSRRSSTSRRCTPASTRCPGFAAVRRSTSASRPTTSTTSATVASVRSASSSRTRSARVCPGWSASCASA